MSERDIKAQFDSDTSEHALTIMRDEGVYRHLRCQRPGSYIFGFDIITWPGYLAYVGDMGSYVFARTNDMFGFFGADGINPNYWSEKLQAIDCTGSRSGSVREFTSDIYRKQVEEWRDDALYWMEEDERESFKADVQSELLDDCDGISEEEAHERLRDFEEHKHGPGDTWEWDMRRFTHHYIWACYAITWAIGQYRAATHTPTMEGED